MSESLGLYISVPFCRMKCTYCNFASGVFPVSDHDRYVEQVCRELREARDRAARSGWRLPEVLGSVYLGGGTPSTLAPEHLRQIFATIDEAFREAAEVELTIECAPGQIAPEFLQAVVEVSRGAQRARASLGVQSLVDHEAASTGRSHTRAIVQEDVCRLHDAGFAVNIDLIAGLPGQTLASWHESLAALCDLQPEHASLYMLEVDEDSRLGREIIAGGARYGAGLVASDDTVAAMYEEGCARLAAVGLQQYEISNFARPGHESSHNLRYWRREPYLGIGLDAHSMLRTKDGGSVRFANSDDLQAYIRQSSERETHVLTLAEQIEEAWFLGLRRKEGVSLAALRREFGKQALASHDETLTDLIATGLMTRTGDQVALTARGRMLSNDVFGRFLGVIPDIVCADEREVSIA